MGAISKGTLLLAGMHFVVIGAPSVARAQTAPSPSAPAQSTPHCASGSDVIERKDGGMYRGTIIDAIPNSDARMTLATGETVTIPWQDIAKVDPCAAAPVAAPASAAPAPGPANSQSLVWVHIEGSQAALIEQDAAGFNRNWEPVCKGACDKALSPAYSYRVVGDGIRSSAPFALTPVAGRQEVLAVSEASKGGFVLGVIGTALGGATTASGLLVVVLSALAKSADRTEDPGHVSTDEKTMTAGWVIAAIGVPFLVGGIALTISNAVTRVSQVVAATPARPAVPSGPARIAAFSDTRREPAVALPPVLGVPLVAGRF